MRRTRNSRNSKRSLGAQLAISGAAGLSIGLVGGSLAKSLFGGPWPVVLWGAVISGVLAAVLHFLLPTAQPSQGRVALLAIVCGLAAGAMWWHPASPPFSPLIAFLVGACGALIFALMLGADLKIRSERPEPPRGSPSNIALDGQGMSP